jgi:hypothetical protein
LTTFTNTANRSAPTVARLRGREPGEGPPRRRRDRLRSRRDVGAVYRIGVFVTGLLFIALGLALAVLPGPLTIPPVVLGLWIWSTEFRFARRLFESFERKGQKAWAQAKPGSPRAAASGCGRSPGDIRSAQAP